MKASVSHRMTYQSSARGAIQRMMGDHIRQEKIERLELKLQELDKKIPNAIKRKDADMVERLSFERNKVLRELIQKRGK